MGVFEVETAYKGDISSPITVLSALDGAACGFGMTEGQRAAVFVSRSGGEWQGGLCSTMSPEALAESGLESIPFTVGESGSAAARWALLGVAIAGATYWGWQRSHRGESPADS